MRPFWSRSRGISTSWRARRGWMAWKVSVRPGGNDARRQRDAILDRRSHPARRLARARSASHRLSSCLDVRRGLPCDDGAGPYSGFMNNGWRAEKKPSPSILTSRQAYASSGLVANRKRCSRCAVSQAVMTFLLSRADIQSFSPRQGAFPQVAP